MEMLESRSSNIDIKKYKKIKGIVSIILTGIQEPKLTVADRIRTTEKWKISDQFVPRVHRSLHSGLQRLYLYMKGVAPIFDQLQAFLSSKSRKYFTNVSFMFIFPSFPMYNNVYHMF